MKTLINTQKDPKFNLALEEYVLKHLNLDDDILLLWQNRPSVIVGRNQNVFEEINMPYLKSERIDMVRRISGGGTVYHDLGNVNFSFITGKLTERLSKYDVCLKPMIDALHQMGLNVYLSGKSDLKIDAFKVSGNAQSFHKNRMLHHGTLLFDSDLDTLNRVLAPNLFKMTSKSVKSNRSQVTNLKPFLNQDMTTETFIDHLRSVLLKSEHLHEHLIELSSEDLNAIQTLVQEKYNRWEWNYGESPDFRTTKRIHLNQKIHDLDLDIQAGIITSCSHSKASEDVLDSLCRMLTGTRFMEENITRQLDVSFRSTLSKQTIQSLAKELTE